MRFLLFLFLPVFGLAQSAPVPVNGRDGAGRPQGLWYERISARMGEPAAMEWGTYSEGRRAGPWYRQDEEGEIVSIIGYRDGVMHGEARYFDGGRLVLAGTYRGLRADSEWDTVYVEDAVTGAERPVRIRTDRGSLRHGAWRYYDARTGRLVREEEWELDEKVDSRSFGMTSADSAYYRKREATLPHVRNPRGRGVRASRAY